MGSFEGSAGLCEPTLSLPFLWVQSVADSRRLLAHSKRKSWGPRHPRGWSAASLAVSLEAGW
jgi:hypothetical protein